MAIFLILFTIILIFIGYKLYQSSKLNLPPGPSPWPIIGNLHSLKPVRFRCFADLSQAYGPIISVWFGSTLNVIVSNSKLAKEVLKDNDQQLADRYRNRSATKLTKEGTGTGLMWADYGPSYVKLKKVCALYFFSPKGLETLRPIRESEVMAMVESIFKHCTVPENYGKCLILRNYLRSMAFNTITRQVLGKPFVSKEGVMDKQGVELLAIVTGKVKLGTTFELAEHIPWLKWVIWPWLKEAAHLELEERRDWLIRAVMEEHKLAPKHDGGGAMHHFVDALLSLNDKYEISEGNKIGLLWDLIIAGMDTSAITVEWAMAQLIKNPRVQQKAQEELDRVIGPDRGISETDFSSLPYLHCVAKEALRLHPPTPLMLPHRANASTKIGGYDIPKGTNVHVNVWAIARDPAVWQDPLEFRPERFIEEDVDVKGHDFRLLPFGAGRRMCPAAQLGVNMVLLTLGNLLHHFCWRTFEGVKPKEIDMSESPGLVAFMGTPLQAIPTLRLPAKLYKHVDI